MDKEKANNLKKDAKVSMEKQEFPDGHVYAYVNGKKSFFPLDKVVISSSGDSKKITVRDLVGNVENQNKRIDKLKEIIVKLNEKITKIEKESKRWNG